MRTLQDKLNEMSPPELERHNIDHWNGKLGSRIRLLEEHIHQLDNYIIKLESRMVP